MITVDCGISGIAEIDYANSLNIDSSYGINVYYYKSGNIDIKLLF